MNGESQNKELFGAAFSGDLNKLKSLVDSGIDINAKNGTGDTALHLAARYGCLSCVDFLVERGAIINACNNDWKQTPLHAAAMAGQLGCLKCLVDHGADIFQKSAEGWNAMHWAAWEGDIKCLKALCDDYGADLNIVDDNDMTPLDVAEESFSEHEEREPELAQKLVIAIGYLSAKMEQDRLDRSIKQTEIVEIMAF